MPAHRKDHPAWQAAFTFVALMLVGVALRVVTLPVFHPALWVATGTLYASLLALLVVRKHDEAVGTKVLAFAAVIGVVQVSVANELIVREGVHVEPFIGAKLMALALALVAPPSLWVALVAVVATGVVPLVEFYHWAPEVRHSMPMNEPWTTLIYSAVALGLLFHRRHQLATQRKTVQAQTRAASFELYMRKFLAVRDLTNSPLQSIENDVGLLRARYPEAKPQLDRIERQIERLESLSAALSKYEPSVWRQEDFSVDPLEVLAGREQLDAEAGNSQAPKAR